MSESTHLRSRRLMSLLALLMTFALVLAACGEDDVADEPEDDDTEEPEDDDVEDEEEADDEEEAEEESAAGLLEGESITFAQGHSADGGFAQYVMLLEPCLEEQLGATVTHAAEPGAGSLLASNATWAHEPDGTRIQLLQGSGTVGSVLGGGEGVEFELDEFTHLGRVASEPRIAGLGQHAADNDIYDLIDEGISFTWAASGPGAASYLDAQLIDVTLGLNSEIVSGFDGTSDAIVAVVAGEIDAHVASLTMVPHVESGDVVPFVQVASERHESVPDTPTTVELVDELDLDDESRAVAETQTALAELSRIVIAPPGMDDDLANELRDALRTCMTDDDFTANADEQGRPMAWLEPDEVESMIDTLLDAPQAVIDALAEEEE